ncbi:hypothetical protein GCM10018793_68630 [Streptomyces sulfonofaciens]|uniref:Transglycosylase SLT domain-containing protein n=1 Tax=Streptomyces sulfonofaciens TaxID=68272 RepID=A0A919LA41_9ACTN|nr:transglycosylase SLT domain-containing protein [Streptomyces sulfonofaciens]GHH88554.1 hypothetical protein GCM10018793_68630 [Streptomyces sulfonofaciens]
MSKRSIIFKTFRPSVPFNRDVLSRDALKREITQKRDSLKRTITDKREALKRGPASGPGQGVALTRTHKVAVAGVATLGAAALAVSLAPDHSAAQHSTGPSAPVAWSTTGTQVHAAQGAGADQKAQVAAAKLKADKTPAPKKDDASKAKAKTKAHHSKAQHAKQAANKTRAHKAVYADNLDGWIRESLHIMKKHHIPGSYNGLYRNIMRESSGNPNAINNWDINAQKGIPSKGLLQVIPPTFSSYHVSGTSWNIYDPVANITAAANYAADRYGSMDNVNSAY